MLRTRIRLLTLLFCLSNTASADILWQYGVDNPHDQGRLNAAEFSSFPLFTPQVFLNVPEKGAILTGPGYLHDAKTFRQICTDAGYNCQYYFRDFLTTSRLTITYNNSALTACTNVRVYYDRHGSETDYLYASYSTTETDAYYIGSSKEGGQYSEVIYLRVDLPPQADITIMLRYIGGGSNNGHFIDTLRLEADGC